MIFLGAAMKWEVPRLIWVIGYRGKASEHIEFAQTNVVKTEVLSVRSVVSRELVQQTLGCKRESILGLWPWLPEQFLKGPRVHRITLSSRSRSRTLPSAWHLTRLPAVFALVPIRYVRLYNLSFTERLKLIARVQSIFFFYFYFCRKHLWSGFLSFFAEYSRRT